MKAIYYRCSTEHQSFLQQQQVVTSYLKRIGENENLYNVVEKVSGSVDHTKRKLNDLLRKCEKGSTIYMSELSRLGRNMSDLFQIVTECCNRGITLIQCKDGTVIENTSIGGKALLFALSLGAEIELNQTRFRTKEGLRARKRRGEEVGGTNRLWGSKNGNKNRSEAIEKASNASAKKRRESARQNPANKAFYEFITDWQAINGRINANTDWQVIADELNKRDKVTSKGLSFNKNRARAMFVKVTNIYEY